MENYYVRVIEITKITVFSIHGNLSMASIFFPQAIRSSRFFFQEYKNSGFQLKISERELRASLTVLTVLHTLNLDREICEQLMHRKKNHSDHDWVMDKKKRLLFGYVKYFLHCFWLILPDGILFLFHLINQVEKKYAGGES